VVAAVWAVVPQRFCRFLSQRLRRFMLAYLSDIVASRFVTDIDTDTDTGTDTDTDTDTDTGTNTDIGTGTGTDPDTDTDTYTDTDTDDGLISGRSSGLLLRSLYITGRGHGEGQAPSAALGHPLDLAAGRRRCLAAEGGHRDRVRRLGPTHVYCDMCSLSDIVASQCACRFEVSATLSLLSCSRSGSSSGGSTGSTGSSSG
jgi:hypothetical protein